MVLKNEHRFLLCMGLALLLALPCSPIVEAAARRPRRQQQEPKTPATSMRAWKDISYIAGSTDPLNMLDIYAPKSGEGRPVVIYIHGGGYSNGDKKTSVGVMPPAFTGKGYVFVSVNYRLSPKVQYPVHPQDVAKAIAWIQKNIAQHGGNPASIFIMGHSAGGQLAALLATDERFLRGEELDLTNLKGAILLDSAAYDIPLRISYNDDHMDRIEDAFSDDPATWKEASPFYYVAKNKGIPPCLLFYVSNRKDSAFQTKKMAQALTAAGVRADIKPAFHTNQQRNRDMGKPGNVPTQEVFYFLASLS